MPSTSLEQYLLELINEARLDPMGNAARYISSYSPLTSPQGNIGSALSFFGVSGSALLSQYSALTPTQPVAFNEQLASAARSHSDVMISTDSQTHQAPGEASLGDRIRAAGYTFQGAGENVFAYSNDVLYGHAGFMVDWGPGSGGMQTPPGHRQNIMNPSFREVGLAVTEEGNPSTTVGPLVITEDFGTRGSAGALILGVAYGDMDRNAFYSIGEGRAGLTVSAGGASATSAGSGGYAVSTSVIGTQRITLDGAGLAGAVAIDTILANGQNVKLDVVDGTTLRTAVSGFVTGPVYGVQAIGAIGLSLSVDDGAHLIAGAAGADTLNGGASGDVIRGGGGSDVLFGRGGDDTVTGNTGQDTVSGNAGFDVLFGGQDADRLFGGQDADVLYGNLGDDTLYGNLGADTLFGGQGADLLFGGQNDDVLNGNLGDDTLNGGLGADRFVFGTASGADRIVGFDAGAGDRLVLGGQSYTISQSEDGSAVLALSGGGTVTLAGVASASVNAGWFA